MASINMYAVSFQPSIVKPCSTSSEDHSTLSNLTYPLLGISPCFA